MGTLKVLKRDRFGREITVECPHCEVPYTLKGKLVTDLENGVVLSVLCGNPECGIHTDVSELTLGGYLWEPPKP
jgi:hypothetical protein